MPGHHRIILLLKQLLPDELTKLITYMYIIIPSRKLKAGQIVIDLGFGHVDRCFSNYECRTFLFGIYTYSYHVTIYRKLLISNPSMTETRAERIIKSCSDVLNSMGNNARIVCFCKKLGVSFPCQTCAPLAKCCLIPFCNNLTINTFPILCKYALGAWSIPETSLLAARKLLWSLEGEASEYGAATTIAAIELAKNRAPEFKRIIAVITGANSGEPLT